MTIIGTNVLQRDPGATVVVAPYGPRGPVIAGTSLTSANIETGDVAFTMTEYGLGFAPGMRLRASAIGAADQWIEGVVTDYVGNLLTINGDLAHGSGIYDTWQVNVAGEPGQRGLVGPTGPTGPVPEAPQDSKNYVRFNAGWQPLDPDLAAIAALTGTNTIYYRSAANVWSPVAIGSGIGFTAGTISAAAGGGNVSNSGTPTAGQLARWINSQQVEGFTPSYATNNALAIASGRLVAYDATRILFFPYNGDRIKIAGVIYPIPPAGIMTANTNINVDGVTGRNLTANTTYYVYLYNNAGTLTAMFSGQAHSTSQSVNNVGVEILGVDEACSLIGMVHTNAGAQFQDVPQFRGVSSWFNRRDIGLYGNYINGSTQSGSPVEISTGTRMQFLNWAGEGATSSLVVYAAGNAPGMAFFASPYLDGSGIAPLALSVTAPVADYAVNMSHTVHCNPSEGWHTFSPYIWISPPGYNATFWLSSTGMIRG